MNRKRGFTVIEIVLVFAIAGVIFLMAFIALPSLWASERDAERRANVIEFVSNIKTYQTNNSRGALPDLGSKATASANFKMSEAKDKKNNKETGTWKAFVRDYVKAELNDPSDNENTFYVVNCLSSDKNNRTLSIGQPCTYGNRFEKVNAGDYPTGKIDYYMYTAVGAVCDGNQAVKSSNDRDVAVVYILERGGRYCYGTAQQ